MLINCSLDRSPSRQSSSSGDLLLEMMESKTPPPASPPHGADDPEVSSRRISPDPPRPEDNPLAARNPQYPDPKESDIKGPYSVQSNALKDLLGASGRLGSASYPNGYGSSEDFVRQKRVE